MDIHRWLWFVASKSNVWGVSLIIFTLRILLCKYLKIMLWLKL